MTDSWLVNKLEADVVLDVDTDLDTFITLTKIHAKAFC
jgi:hypothetical protein